MAALNKAATTTGQGRLARSGFRSGSATARAPYETNLGPQPLQSA
jgi:hypothetical protein